jgi:hypothetical protein
LDWPRGIVEKMSISQIPSCPHLDPTKSAAAGYDFLPFPRRSLVNSMSVPFIRKA